MPEDLKMALRNIWRNPRRTLLTIAAISFAAMLLVFMLSFQFGSYETMINSSVKIHAGHLQVQADEYQEKKSMRLVVSDPLKVAKILENTEGVEAFTFRANAFSLASSKQRTSGILVVGIDPEKEAKVSTLKNLMREGSYLSGDDTDKALIGKLLARNLKVGPGDELTILGQGKDGSIAAFVVTVKGIYSSGIDEFDRSSIQIPLSFFQDVYFMHGAVHEIVAVCTSLMEVSQIKNRIKEQVEESIQTSIKTTRNKYNLKVLDWQELMPGLLQGIEMDLVSGLVFYAILILVVAFSIMNTFLMAIFERTKEFGVLMAIGTTPGRLTRMLLIESMAMTMIGITTGIVIGSLITIWFQIYGIDISGSSDLFSQFGISGRIYPRLSVVSALTGSIAIFIITFFSALYPAMKIRRLRPVEALKNA